jgi:hypothetical protein
MLSLGKASNQIRNMPPLFRGLSFLLLSCTAPSVCVTKLGVLNLEIDQKMMRYSERCKMATLYLINQSCTLCIILAQLIIIPHVREHATVDFC